MSEKQYEENQAFGENVMGSETKKKSGFSKNTYIIIITVVTVLCIIAGTIIHIVGAMNNFSIFSSAENNREVTQEFDFDNITEIHVDANLLELDLQVGDAYHVEYQGTEKLLPTVEEKNGVLEISQRAKRYSNNQMKMPECVCTITVPADAVLSSLTINMDLGDLEFSDLSVEELTIETDLGSVVLENISVETLLSIKADLGNVELTSCNFASSTIEADLGNIEIEKCEFASGDFSADMGNIEIDGTFERIKADCSMGSIDVHSDDIDNATLNLETEMGSVTVNGIQQGTKYNH